MQKSTLFTILLAMIVVAAVADLLVHNPLRGNWQEYRSANVVKAEEEPERRQETEIQPEASEKLLPEESTFAPPALVSTFLSQRSFILESLDSKDLSKAGFQNMKLEKAPYDQMIFQLLDVSTYPNLSAVRFHLTDSKNVFGVLHEFEFEKEAQAVSFYADLKQKVGAFSPQVTSNEINQYADNSFFMNDRSRSGTAFLVFRLNNHLLAFSYPKASHEFFKTLIISLAK